MPKAEHISCRLDEVDAAATGYVSKAGLRSKGETETWFDD